MGLRTWVDDPSPIVRYEALRVAPTCDRAVAALADISGHVALLAVDLLGSLPCRASDIEPLTSDEQPWRVRAHALVSLARVTPEAARLRLSSFAADPMWQVRVYAARAARLLDAEDVRASLAADSEPNVVIAAMTEETEAVRALESSHRGLLIEAARLLADSPALAAAVPSLVTAFLRLSGENRPTSRDAKMALLDRVADAALDDADSLAVAESLRPWLSDRDPVVAERLAGTIATLTGEAVEPITRHYVDDALPSDEFISDLVGATADITMAGLGTFTIELLTEDTPATVGVFARHAENGGYDGTTFHRVVPNFVLQGGSPGAHEVDGAVGPYMRDELGLVRHLRGTLGISTRGRDTGDGQIFVNLVDNFRLDHEYTVWARVVSGMDIVDRILEGDVIERVTITRK
jgi:cyclophilin family peptidyl-prolyl cis-trans isomerase